VVHPTFVYIPAVLKVLDGLLLFLSSLRTVTRIRREFDFDLIDAHFAFPDGFAAILLGWWFDRPVTITLRGTLIPLSRYWWRRQAIAWTVRRAQWLIAVATPLAERAISLGASAERMTVIPNGVDIEQFFPADKTDARRALGLPATGRMLVSVGHLSPRKGFHRVLTVLPELLQVYPDLTFAIVGGPGAERDNAAALHATADAPPLRGRVVFAGAQPPTAVRHWLNAADVFVLASDYEGCPNAVWEAMGCGRPVVVSKVGEVERMVPPFAGLLFDDPNDSASLARCLRDAFSGEWRSEQIREYAAAHTWERVASQVFAEWSRAVSSHNHRPGEATAVETATERGRHETTTR